MSSYQPFLSTSSAVCMVCAVWCFVTPVTRLPLVVILHITKKFMPGYVSQLMKTARETAVSVSCGFFSYGFKMTLNNRW